IGNLDLMEGMVENNDKIQPLVNNAIEASLRGAELTRQLLAFSRRQSLAPQIVDINKLAGGMVNLLRHTLGEHIVIKLMAGSDIWPVIIDAAQLESAILNLSVNARDAMPNGGSLTIETRNHLIDETYVGTGSDVPYGDYVAVEVTDTGTGI